VDQGLLAAIIGLAVSVLVNAVTVAFRLGRLEQTVADLRTMGSEHVHERLARLEVKVGLSP
jgi:flagellar motor switch/type III secretory pathway protein FliN